MVHIGDTLPHHREPEHIGGPGVTAGQWIALVQALVWPAVVLTLIFVFWKQLHHFADRLTHVRVGGQEFIARTIEASQLFLRSIPVTKTRPEAVPRKTEEAVVQLAATDPQAALIRLGREIDRAVRRLAVVGNWLEPMERQPDPLWRRLLQLSRNVDWDADVLGFVLVFSILEEGAVAGDKTLSKEDMKRLVDQGLTVLGLINSIPRETHVVLASKLPVFEDQGLTQPMANRSGVLLKTISDDGRETIRAFFTSRPDYYKPDMRVGYEWRENPPRDELRGWTADPTSNPPGSATAVIGWDFQGRDLADVLG
jgi:hypothetical protein